MLREIKIITTRKEFLFAFMILFFAVIGEFFYACYMFKDCELSG